VSHRLAVELADAEKKWEIGDVQESFGTGRKPFGAAARGHFILARPLPGLHHWRGDEGAQRVKKTAVVSCVCKSLQGCSTRFTEGGVS
jgi:hypothetical protein